MEGDKPKRKFKAYPIDHFHIDIAEVRTEDGKLHMFVAIDRTSKLAFAELHQRTTRAVAKAFLNRLKSLKGPTPYEFIVKCWTDEPSRFRLNPIHHFAGSNT